MSKYSLQTECLENIEAYSDEQFNAEMAVIESAMAIFDKAILMMELSNSDIDIPDCSLFMESTFFQEDGDQPPAADGNTGDGGESNPAPAAEAPAQQPTNDGNKTDANKPAPTEAERKKYNSENQFRQMNKKGNIENMFISIIAFIPRLLGFLIQCVVKLFKKIFNKEADEAIKKSDASAQTLSAEEITEAVSKADAEPAEDTSGADTSGTKEPQAQAPASANNNTPPSQSQSAAPVNNTTPSQTTNATNEQKTAGTINPQTKMWEWYDEQAIIKCIEDAEKIINLFTLDNYTNIEKLKKFMPDITRRLDAVMNSRIEVQGNVLVNSKNNIAARFNAFEKSINGTKTELDKYIKDNNLIKKKLFGKDEVSSRGQVVLDLKNSVELLKNFSKSFSKGSTEIINSYNTTAGNARKINKAAANKGSSQPQAQPAQNQQPVNNAGGENPNGGQEQNNPANT